MVKQAFHKQAAVYEKHSNNGKNHPAKPSGLLDTILSNTTLADPLQNGSPSDKINGIIVGKVVNASARTAPLVDFPANATGAPVQALATVPVVDTDISRDVALAFVNGEVRTPVILGFMHVPSASQVEIAHATEHTSRVIKIEKDGETVTISADKQIVLKCGESSITLTRAGKVLLSGAYVSSKSKGVNRIMGGSVLIN